MLLKKDATHALVSAGQEVRKPENLEKEDDVNDAEADPESDGEADAETETDAKTEGIGVKETRKTKG